MDGRTRCWCGNLVPYFRVEEHRVRLVPHRHEGPERGLCGWSSGLITVDIEADLDWLDEMLDRRIAAREAARERHFRALQLALF